jgi:Tol biopolymer transport system component
MDRLLVWVDRTGAVEPIMGIRRVFEDPRLSPDARTLAVTIWDQDISHVSTLDIENANLSRLTFGSDGEETPIWTPDGESLIYRSGSPANLDRHRADGSDEPERLTVKDLHQTPTSVTSDGGVLVYHERESNSSGKADVWRLTLGVEPTAHVLLRTPFNASGGVLSPDGRFLTYHSDEFVQYEVFVRSLTGPGGRWQLSSDGGMQPLWARNGREIFYRNGDKVFAVLVSTEPSFQSGRPGMLFERRFAMASAFFAEYDVTPDGRFVMLQDLESLPTQIYIVQNWFEELKARVPASVR